jgi:hypothetical protein
MTFSYSGYNTYSSNCTALTQTANIPYGFVSNYNSSGEAALLLYENGTWNLFAHNNNYNYNTVDTVQFNGTSFSYSVGYQNYYAYSTYYGYGYFTNYWSGSGYAY